jgi:nucleoside-diphosphate-sugar epimerase
MKVLVAGATGALGKQLVPRLAAAGHEVTGMTRSESKRDALRALGAVPSWPTRSSLRMLRERWRRPSPR